MKIFNNFQITLPGKSHKSRGLNCQDQAFCSRTSDRIIGLVADGIGSIQYSEVSSFLYSTSIINCIEQISLMALNKMNLCEVFEDHILTINKTLGSILKIEHLNLCLGSTIVLYVITEEFTSIYSKGDGFYGITTKPLTSIIELKGNNHYIDLCTFERNIKIPTSEVKSVWVATDGLRFSRKLKNELEEPDVLFPYIFETIKKEYENDLMLDDFGIAISVED